jgi:hypothetical protein
VTGSTFQNNSSLTAVGGGLFAGRFLALNRSVLTGNQAAVNGGGLALQSHGSLNSRIYNSVLAHNGGGGAALHISGSLPLSIMHATLVGADSAPVGIEAEGVDVQIINSIIVSHTVGIVAAGGAAVTADHSLFYGNQTNVQGVTNLNPVVGDPRFLDVAGGDFHLALGSAAVDVAKVTAVAEDWEGDLRPIIASPDIGADEFGDSAVVDPSTTTTMTSTVGSGREIIIRIPPGALGGSGTIRLLPTFPPTLLPLPPRQTVGSGFQLRLTPPERALLQIDPTFLLPVTMTLTYTDADVAEVAEYTLFLAVLDEETGEWVDATETCAPAGVITRDLASNQVTVTTCATGEFALLGSPGVETIYLPLVIR